MSKKPSSAFLTEKWAGMKSIKKVFFLRVEQAQETPLSEQGGVWSGPPTSKIPLYHCPSERFREGAGVLQLSTLGWYLHTVQNLLWTRPESCQLMTGNSYEAGRTAGVGTVGTYATPSCNLVVPAWTWSCRYHFHLMMKCFRAYSALCLSGITHSSWWAAHVIW